MSSLHLESPYGLIWFEWPLDVAKSTMWEDAVQREMVNLSNLVSSGYLNHEHEVNTFTLGHMPLGSTTTASSSQINPSGSTVSLFSSEDTQISEEAPPPSSKVEIYATPRRAKDHHHHQHTYSTSLARDSDGEWGHRFGLRPSADRSRPSFMGHHRNTLSSPCFLSKGNY